MTAEQGYRHRALLAEDPPVPAVVVFVDIARGGGSLKALDGGAAIAAVSRVHGQLADVTARHLGRVVKTVGTAMMCTFPRVDRAAMASGDMHLRVRNAAAPTGPPEAEARALGSLRLRVGMHVGPVLEEGGDLFGDTVNVAARLMALAKADQTLCSGAILGEMSSELRGTTRFRDRVSPRGKTTPIEVYEIVWEVEDITMAAPASVTSPERARHSRLVLRCAGQEHELGEAMPVLTLGRDADNDLVYPGGFASRKHARIEFSRGRFVITDQSANGTYIVGEDGTMVPVRRDRYVLEGAGRIYLGELPDPEAAGAIAYECS